MATSAARLASPSRPLTEQTSRALDCGEVSRRDATPTLEDVILGAWEDLAAEGRAGCPVCGGRMGRGGCGDCGAALSA